MVHAAPTPVADSWPGDSSRRLGFLASFLADYVRARGCRVEKVVDLWAHHGGLLPRLVGQSGITHAVGLIPDIRLAPIPDTPEEGSIDWVEKNPWDFVREGDDRIDLVLGILPWRWQPERTSVEWAGRDVTMVDDVSCATVAKACERLGPDGIGLFVVAPGFVMRPGKATAFARLCSLGVGLESLVVLPRGAFQPDTGTGRLLIGLARTPPRETLTGSFAAPLTVARLLGNLTHRAPDARSADDGPGRN